jgi:flagellar basal-body rod modification protein FlgD
LADNFQSFLTLLTTQLQNQDPMSPMDTNQFTQQLVEFSQVEQQLKSNDELASLVSLQTTAQATQALNFVGKTAVVAGSTAVMSNSQATWNITSASASTAQISITNSTGQTVYSGSYNVPAGTQSFVWNGQGTDGTQWPDGNYTIAVSGKDANGNSVAMSTQIEGTVNSVDLTANPPLLSIGGQNYTVNQINSIVN